MKLNKFIMSLSALLLLSGCSMINPTSSSSSSSQSSTSTSTSSTTETSTSTSTSSSEPGPETKGEWTLLFYICGADLESESSLATSDLVEIASVTGQPENVNIVVEAGGANKWDSRYSSVIDASKLNRFHLRNNEYVLDEQIAKASMGAQKTLQSFIEFGINNYYANHMALILWNHGGGMRGVCYDENYMNNSLTDYEVVNAVSGAFTKTGVTKKFDFIGYDACLMQLQDIAEFNSPYFNYMVAAQESEAGEGWDYDNWIDNVYAYDSTLNICKEICDTFIEDNGGVDVTDDERYYTDQTLSYLDLSYANEYKEAWEELSLQLKDIVKTSNKSSFNKIIGATKMFAGSDYDYFGLYDAYHFLTLLEKNSTFNPGGTYIENAKNALNKFVAYNCVQKKGAHDAHGVSFYYYTDSGYGGKGYSTATYSNFTNWSYLSKTFGGSVTSTYVG